jgi:hypothetical protein
MHGGVLPQTTEDAVLAVACAPRAAICNRGTRIVLAAA